tara:strand:- start:84 stop:1265 length:1182 start_codon:yes stop_codon:yes gene_type:complete
MKQTDYAFQGYGTDAWENQTLSYSLDKYPFPDIVHEILGNTYHDPAGRVRALPPINDLSLLHESIPYSRLQEATEFVQNSFADKKYQQMFEQFAEEYIKPLIGNKTYLIKRQPTLNLVVPDQQKYHRKLPFHQGIFYNNGRGMRTIWMPLTKCYDSNSMYIANLEDSRKLTALALKDKYSYTKWEQECYRICKPVKLNPGQAHLFHQEHIHGNINNITDRTRLAIDWHVLIEGEEYGGRYPGGFFRKPQHYNAHDPLEYHYKTKFITYIGNNTQFDKHIPLHIQRLVIDNYYQERNIRPTIVQFENEHMTWMPILFDIIENTPDALGMFSIYSLPEDKQLRTQLYDMIIQNKTQIHFANELCTLKSVEDASIIEYYLNFGIKQKGNFIWQEEI